MNRILIGTALALAMTVAAQAEDEFDCWWSSIDCGGGMSSGGQFDLNGTIGQWDGGPANKESMTGGTFELIGGYWAEEAPSCLGDFDGSGGISAPDIAILLGAWGGTGAADLDQNGTVGAPDLAILLGAWGDCP
ncbi:MAG: hypothetical protein JNL80_11825 [Phycisphaerae bacterium]|jgi:hypothetical protein|nr:hypothetical protein [Phycisphaerae bacterium]